MLSLCHYEGDPTIINCAELLDHLEDGEDEDIFEFDAQEEEADVLELMDRIADANANDDDLSTPYNDFNHAVIDAGQLHLLVLARVKQAIAELQGTVVEAGRKGCQCN